MRKPRHESKVELPKVMQLRSLFKAYPKSSREQLAQPLRRVSGRRDMAGSLVHRKPFSSPGGGLSGGRPWAVVLSKSVCCFKDVCKSRYLQTAPCWGRQSGGPFRGRLWLQGEALVLRRSPRRGASEGKAPAVGNETWSLLKFSLEGYVVTQKQGTENSEGQQNYD